MREFNFDCLFPEEKQYTVFYDKDGILTGGLWVMFKTDVQVNLEVLSSPVIGDIMLAVDKSYDIKNPDPKKCITDYIVGFAIPTDKDPKHYHIRVNIFLHQLNKQIEMGQAQKNGVSVYNKAVYDTLMGRMRNSRIKIVDHLTMTERGVRRKKC